jgi:hypothetical protein
VLLLLVLAMLMPLLLVNCFVVFVANVVAIVVVVVVEAGVVITLNVEAAYANVSTVVDAIVSSQLNARPRGHYGTMGTL